MLSEIEDVKVRCTLCNGAVIVQVIAFGDLDEGHAPRRWEERVPHSRLDCKRQMRLNEEEWPVSF